MLIALLAILMFFAMLAATFNAVRSEMTPVRVSVRDVQRSNFGRRHTFGSR